MQGKYILNQEQEDLVNSSGCKKINGKKLNKVMMGRKILFIIINSS